MRMVPLHRPLTSSEKQFRNNYRMQISTKRVNHPDRELVRNTEARKADCHDSPITMLGGTPAIAMPRREVVAGARRRPADGPALAARIMAIATSSCPRARHHPS